mgnify:FL=1|tara:strand:+ start:180 stop:611 length:432 start_codon:yes stop_codon:yes gene_type:complete
MEIKEKYNYNKKNMKKKEIKELDRMDDTLITYGEEALTMRKDDPRTQEFIKSKKEETLETLKIQGENDLWAGISLSNTRQKDETYKIYKDRLKTNKGLEKIYKQLGRDECKKQYPYGFAYAIYIAMNEMKEKNEEKFNINEKK